MLKKSHTKNAILQKHIVEEHKMELALQLDIVTRWCSIVPMVEKFLRLQQSIKKSLIDLEMGELWIEENVMTLNSMLKVLGPINLAVKKLSSRDINILIAEAVINVLCDEIKSIPSILGGKMFQALYQPINESRDKKLYTLVKYLKEPTFFNNNREKSLISYASKSSVIRYAETLLIRLFFQIRRY